MVTKIINNNLLPPIDESNKEQEVNSTQVGSGEQAMITEYGFPAATDLRNAAASVSLTADRKNIMNMEAGLLQKALNEELSSKASKQPNQTVTLLDYEGSAVKAQAESNKTQHQQASMLDYEGSPVVTYSVKESNTQSEAHSKDAVDANETNYKMPANIEVPN